MTSNQILLVKKSWRRIREIDPLLLAEVFYNRLFSMHPSVRKMFPENLEEQYGKLLDAFNIIVMRLEDLDSIKQQISELGARHKDYGTKPEHFSLMGETLIHTLKECLGEEWNMETEEAWDLCFETLSNRMMITGYHSNS
jgi:hemoglobin-like flavoprotein